MSARARAASAGCGPPFSPAAGGGAATIATWHNRIGLTDANMPTIPPIDVIGANGAAGIRAFGSQSR
jgi:hypothetical protein